MSWGEEIRRMITSIVDSRMPIITAWCTVKSVSGDGQFCDVIVDDDTNVVATDILLGYDKSGQRIKPGVNSLVLVLFVTSTNGVVIMAEKTDSLELLGNSFGGIMKLQPVLSAINAIQNDINELKTQLSGVLGGVPIPETGNGAASALQAALSTALSSWGSSSLTVTTQSDIENDKITHGNGE